jgi:hypothetical protein
VQFVAATALTLLVFVALANLVVDLYARGVVRAAVDEGARAGAPIDSSAVECEQRARQVLHNLLGGRLGRDVRVECHDAQGRMNAGAVVVLHGWIPGVVPDWTFDLVGSATKEHDP